MNKLEILRRQISVGTQVTLRLTKGSDITGRVAELDESYIRIDRQEGPVTVFADILAAWEMHREEAGDGHSIGDRKSMSRIDLGNSMSEADASIPKPLSLEPSINTPKIAAEAAQELVRIKAEFSVKLGHARLALPKPDFRFPKNEFPESLAREVEREWIKAKNRYEYAVKTRELNRISDIVTQILRPLNESYPHSATTQALLGTMLLNLDRRPEALDHLALATAESDDSAHWFALAVAAGSDTAVECYALRRHFLLRPPARGDDSWFRYIAVATEHHDLRRISQIIFHWHERAEADAMLRRVLGESAVYLLSQLETEVLALQATDLILTSSELPPNWEDAFSNSPSPSAELVAAEQKLVRSPRSTLRRRPQFNLPAGSADVHRGRIAWFDNNSQRFGFIKPPNSNNQQYYFSIGDIEDGDMRDALLNGRWGILSPSIEFEILPRDRGRKYERAIKIRPLEDEIKENIQKRVSSGEGLPKGEGSYARAKRAQFVDHDLDTAEKLLKEATLTGDNAESAMKDLASLLQQQGRVDEAIALLEKASRRAKDISSYGNMLATFYQHASRHEEAVQILEQLFQKSPRAKKSSLLARIATSHLRARRFAAAEETLRKLLDDDPHNRTAPRLLDALENARDAESQDEVDEAIGDIGLLTDDGLVLSSLARAAINQCTYEGVEQEKVQNDTADRRDVKRVVELAKKVSTKAPRDRAAYYLSAAALIEKDTREGVPVRIYDYLRRYFTSMADAFWADRKSADVVRSHYIESLALVVNDNLDEAWRSLVLYLVTFSPEIRKNAEATLPRDKPDSPSERREYIDALQKTILMIPSSTDGWTTGLINVGAQSRFARSCLCQAFLGTESLRVTFGRLLNRKGSKTEQLQASWESRCREYARHHRKQLIICETMTRYAAATPASMEDLRLQVNKVAEDVDIELDRRRLNALGDIVDSALEFCRATEFEERERNYWLVTRQAEGLKKEVMEAPTQYSHEGLLRVADYVNSLIEEEYAEMNRTSSADLGLALMVEKYLPGLQGELRLQFAVSNRSGCSPASSVRIRLGPDGSKYFRADPQELEVTSTLRGGETLEVQMVVYPQDAAVRDRAFPIIATARYRNRLGEDKHTADHARTVRLYRDEEFQTLGNPYAPFSEGGPVNDSEMFFGRSDLLGRLETSLRSQTGRKSVVMFGQKRAGKSSIVEHLRRRLAESDDVFPVSFSLQEIASDLSEAALLHRIVYGIWEVLEDLRLEGREVPEFRRPRIEEMYSNAMLRFHSVMSDFVREMRRRSPGLHIVLLIDEFTEIFKAIRNKRIPREFMKAWKAIIEKGYFSSVLVGQDIMPAFKEAFPNEFGVTEDIRVTYLDEAAARALVQEPIGKERFAGDAVRRLLDLTANSPYYTMMFCARLVDYMNATRSMVVTAADILTVKDHMLLGDDRWQDDRRLTADKFDNLLAAGDGKQDSGIDPGDTHAVCAAIANIGGKGWCARESMSNLFQDAELDKLLSDLESRDVVERKDLAYRLRVGLFQEWLRLRSSER